MMQVGLFKMLLYCHFFSTRMNNTNTTPCNSCRKCACKRPTPHNHPTTVCDVIERVGHAYAISAARRPSHVAVVVENYLRCRVH